MLQVRELTATDPWVARLRYAYADALIAVGRGEEGREWFARAAEVDEDALTDAAERLLDLDGVVFDLPVDDEDDEDDGADESGDDDKGDDDKGDDGTPPDSEGPADDTPDPAPPGSTAP
jgi:hypothetical protein